MNEMTVIIAIVAAILYLNVVSIYHSIRRKVFTVSQIVFQSLAVLMVPVVGALALLIFNFSEKAYRKRMKEQSTTYIAIDYILGLAWMTFFMEKGVGKYSEPKTIDDDYGDYTLSDRDFDVDPGD